MRTDQHSLKPEYKPLVTALSFFSFHFFLSSELPAYYDFTTTASYTGNVEVCIEYSQPPPEIDESLLRVLHFVGSSWTDVTTSLDTAQNTICGTDTTISPFIIGFSEGCCDTLGDADNSGAASIGDVTFLISYIFSGGPAPNCHDEGDADGNNSINISDVTYLIAYIFSGGIAPICGTTGS